ncbi:MAG TPA: hypothetical protein VFG08_08130 [Candidatus Polarisedimenticolia bacterium]|nr:hypothetical protein [Candidatus Polarisedimenticolia bacterium]
MHKPTHPLPQFAALVAIAAPLLLGLCLAIDRTFLDDPDAAGILAAERYLFRDVATAHDLLDRMIERDEVTWDPTNGVRIGRVLAHLKRSDGPKLLLIGSSQLLVVRDDRSPAGIARRVDKVLDDRLAGRATVYNLSLGGMTLAERQWVLEQAVRLVEFDYIVVGMTLWDSASDEVRPWLARPRDPLPGSPQTGRPAIARLAPAAINRAVTGRFSRALEETIPFFRHRTAIQRWLKGEAARAVSRDDRTDMARDSPAPLPAERGGAEPVHYSYSTEEQASILARVDAFISTLQTIRSSTGARIMVVLTPFRQDADRPVYSPPALYERFRDTVESGCKRGGLVFLDASSLLGRRHFGTYRDGADAGKIDVLHFDAAGHGELAGAIEGSALFHPALRAAG